MANLPVIIPQLIGIIGFAHIGIYHLRNAESIAKGYYERVRHSNRALRILFPAWFYGSRAYDYAYLISLSRVEGRPWQR
jgi:hypothetical protein